MNRKERTKQKVPYGAPCLNICLYEAIFLCYSFCTKIKRRILICYVQIKYCKCRRTQDSRHSSPLNSVLVKLGSVLQVSREHPSVSVHPVQVVWLQAPPAVLQVQRPHYSDWISSCGGWRSSSLYSRSINLTINCQLLSPSFHLQNMQF